jgi:hypothetical protein
MLGFFTTLAIGHIPSFSLTRLPTRREPPVMSATLPASDISRVVCDIAISSDECLVPSGTITLYGAGDAGQGACVCPSPVWRRVGWAVGWVTVDAGACRSTLPPHLNPPPQGGRTPMRGARRWLAAAPRNKTASSRAQRTLGQEQLFVGTVPHSRSQTGPECMGGGTVCLTPVEGCSVSCDSLMKGILELRTTRVMGRPL